MSKIILKVIPALACWSIFAYVVLQIPYPETLTQANAIQIFPFFISLYLALLLTLNIFLKNILFSASVCLGLILLLILKALDSLNIVTVILIAVATYFLASYFKKGKRKNLSINSGFKNLNKRQKPHN
jgi:hypothetical protein